jgi:two-component system response regulator HydG
MAADKPRVLVVDDELSMAETVADALDDRGFEAIAIGSSKEAARRLADEPIDALVTDLRMPGLDGFALLSASKKSDPLRPVIVVTAFGAIDSAIESIRQGASHYLTKPFKLEELALFLGRAIDEARVRKEAAALRRTLHDQFGLDNIVGRGPAMQRVLDRIARTAEASTPILLLGETGTGKGLVARALHARSGRSAHAFVTVNCAAIPENLLESELFGHVRGAFTGATANRQGLIAEAHGGTLFLDEIGDMPIGLQGKLLDVLERGVVRAVGATQERTVDVRFVAATHQNLRDRVKERAFREDLLYRIDVVSIEMPPLRQRRDDIPALVEHFLEKAKRRHPRSKVERIAPAALKRMLEHEWPGNVRELEHTLERMVLLAAGTTIEVDDLPSSIGRREGSLLFEGPILPVRELQRPYAAWALAELGGRRTLTAERLGIDGKTLAKWLQEPDAES